MKNNSAPTGRIVGPPVPSFNPSRPLSNERRVWQDAHYVGGLLTEINYVELEHACRAHFDLVMFRAKSWAFLRGQRVKPWIGPDSYVIE